MKIKRERRRALEGGGGGMSEVIRATAASALQYYGVGESQGAFKMQHIK